MIKEVLDPQDIFFNRPGVAVVTWDATSEVAHIEWQGWANSTEFAEANDAVIRALREHRGSKALGDCRQMKVIQKSDQDWSNQSWFPRVLAAGLTRLALVIPISGLAMMNVHDIMSRVPGSKLDVAYFVTIDEARAWLARPRRPTTSPPIGRETSSIT